MIKSVESFFERAKANTPACKEYSLKIMHAKSKLEVFKAGLEIQSIEFLCKAIDEGWGMTSDEICADFAPYINGKCVYDEKYTSELYCRFDGTIKAKSTVYCLIDCDCCLNLEEEWRMCKVYIVGKSSVRITGKGTAFVEFCGENCNTYDAVR